MAITTKWYEWNGNYPGDKGWPKIRKILLEIGPVNWHCFYDEPWTPFLLRVEVHSNEAMPPSLGNGHWVDCDMTPDIEGFGSTFPFVMSLFTAACNFKLARMLGDKKKIGPLANHAKLLHCILNSWSFRRYDEAEFHMKAMVAAGVFDIVQNALHVNDSESLSEISERVSKYFDHWPYKKLESV